MFYHLQMYGSDKNYTKWTKCKQLKGLQLISHVSRVEIHLSMISASSVDMLVKWNGKYIEMCTNNSKKYGI